MEEVKPSHEILFIQPDLLELIEKAGRTCYKSEEKITEGSAEKFVKMITKRGHHSVIEHASITVRFICDRGVSHEIVRHRLAAYSQESTRYCNYSKGGIQIIFPGCLTNVQRLRREILFEAVQAVYNQEIRNGLSPQIARGVLPTALKTKVPIIFDDIKY